MINQNDNDNNATLAEFIIEPVWTRTKKLKDFAITTLAFIASCILVVIPLLGFARTFGLFSAVHVQSLFNDKAKR